MRMPSVMPGGHRFSQVPRADIPRSTFDRSHAHKTTFDAGYLIPIYVDEALPGDTFNLSMAAFARLATPIKPLMDNVYLETFFFAVPVRLVWENWERFNGAQDNPDDTTSYVVPTFSAHEPADDSLSNYMGIPSTGQLIAPVTFSTLHHRAYNLIWNTWFRDQNLQDSVVVDKDDGPDSATDYVLLRRGKRHDYFTSSLPWPQKGAAVALPLGTSAPVVPTLTSPIPLFTDATGLKATSIAAGGAGTPFNIISQNQTGAWAGGDQLVWTTPTGLMVDLSAATAATINQLRQAFQVQKLLERDARGGTRYTEILKAQFGVTSPDARLQRPEYLGGGHSPVIVSPIAQNSATDVAVSPQGNLAGIGTASFQGHGFTKSFTEHCLLIGLVSARADLTYQQGMPRMFSRSTRYDFYWPALAQIGEQAVLSKEIYMNGVAEDDNAPWGYQERYAEYRYKPSIITGKFKSTTGGTLDIWHLSQKFTTRPALSAAFIEEDPPIDRVIAVPTEPHFLFDSFFSLKCARPMPVFGVPGLIDHF